MDFLKILRSLEELLYEVMTWLVTYPATLWKVTFHPQLTGHRIESECDKPEEEQFTALLSPPLFLMLSVLLAHGLELCMHVAFIRASGPLARVFAGDEQFLLAYRSLSFAIWPLAGSVFLLRNQGKSIDRNTLRRPFFAQCYLVAPCAIAMSCASVLLRMKLPWVHFAGLGMFISACIWYVFVQARWFHDEMQRGWFYAVRITLRVLAIGLIINVSIALLLFDTRSLAVTGKVSRAASAHAGNL